MLRKILTIAKNTFIETLRQPIFFIIVFIAILIFILTPSISMYSIDDDNKLLYEFGTSTLFLTGLFISIFSSIGAITEELESKTAMTVLSKPVPRWNFIIGKFLGITGAVALAHLVVSIAMMLTFRHGVMETARDEIDWTVITVSLSVLLLSLLISAIMNYYYDNTFTSTCMVLLTILGSIGFAALCFLDKEWKFNPAENGFNMFDVYSSILLFFAILVLISIAIALSTRFNIIMTLILCIAFFLLGLISDYIFGRFADTHIWAQIGRLIFPNLQIYWISDAIYQDGTVPLSYIWKVALYSICYTFGVLGIASALFQGKQVGKS